MDKADWANVQALVWTGYPKLPCAAFIPWRITDPNLARQWLAGLTKRVEIAKPWGPEPDVCAVNVAMTASGFAALEVDKSQMKDFSTEFLEGMAPRPDPSIGTEYSRRSSQLGDIGPNSPADWFWGGWNNHSTVHGMLLLYARRLKATKDDDDECKEIDALIDRELGAMTGVAPLMSPETGLMLLLRGYTPANRKEHFGFTDGISQPMIANTPDEKRMTAREKEISLVSAGEFVLGHRDERDHADFADKFPASGPCEFQRSGTYLVFRQLEQDMHAFSAYLAETAVRIHGHDSADTREKVAALLIGRKRSGEPLIPPPRDWVPPPGRQPQPRNDFLYHFDDPGGIACPVGSHVRRANPRDSLEPDPDTSLQLSKRHRLLRRGRLFGKQLPNGAFGEVEEDGESRGLYFIALNADISGQFELIQHSWLGSTHFGGLYDERDPLHGARGGTSAMTIQQRPTNLRLEGLKAFVTMRGGAYFFMPGITALRTLARPHVEGPAAAPRAARRK